MSVEAMAIALHHSRAKGAEKLMLIGIANHSGDGGAWPSLRTLMKYAGITDRRGAQRLLRHLESLGEIRTYVSAGGDHSTADYLKPNLYKFTLECPFNCDHSMNHRTPKDEQIDVELEGADETPPGGAQTAGRGGAGTAQTRTLNHLHLVKDPDPSTRVGDEEDALPRDAVESPAAHVETSLERYTRLINEKCPGRANRKHDFRFGPCGWCAAPQPKLYDPTELVPS